VDETNDLLEHLRPWKTSHIQDQRPPPLIIEVYIDVGSSGQQSLILQDELGHQWGVEDAIKSYIEVNGEKMPTAPRVVLERWRCQLGRQTRELPADLPTVLPKVYKNSIVLFRSLFAYLKLLPAWELTRKRHLKSSQRPPKMKYRIYAEGRNAEEDSAVFDELELALDDGRSPVTEQFAFDPIDSPSGPYTVEVAYRRRCDFRWERSMESVYSSKFIGQDEDLFRPSLDRYNHAELPERDSTPGRREVGSLPQRRPNLREMAEQSQAYGSMSTYHNTTTRVSSSPMSALRAAREYNMRSPTEDSPPNKGMPDTREQGSSSRDRADAASAAPRRTSVSFMPFKTHSLSASPLQIEVLATAPHRQPQPIGRTSALTALANARRPSNARDSPIPLSETPASLSSSPRPGRYSSSFGHRRARLSVGGSKTEDDNSSGKASVASSAQPGSTVIPGGNNSSGSLNTDDDNISDFLKMLDQTRDLKSFQIPVDSSMEASKRMAPGLAKYQRLRDTNSALTESMTTSLQMQRTPSGSQRQPPMAAPTAPAAAAAGSASSSSAAERMSPRTPHTPAVPSRLSANSIIDYTNPELEAAPGPQKGESRGAYLPSNGAQRSNVTVAIDIPTSPRFNPSYRRSSSAVHREGRVLDYDLGEVLQGFATRSASMGDRDERQPVPMNELLAQEGSSGKSGTAARAATRLSGGVDMARERSNDSQKSNEDDSPMSPRFRPRLGGGGSRRVTHGSSTSLAGAAGSGSTSSDVRSSRYSFTRPGAANLDDEEPLLFAMSDFTAAQPGRKSLEETARRNEGGGESGPGEAPRSPGRSSSRKWS
jgi:autophagy-related protein 13